MMALSTLQTVNLVRTNPTYTQFLYVEHFFWFKFSHLLTSEA